MALAAFTATIELIDWVEEESNSIDPQTQILKQELRFIRMFLKYTANRCTEYENLQQLFTRITLVGQDVAPLRKKPGCKSCLLFKRSATSNQFRDVDDALRAVLDKIKLVKPEIREVQMRVSRLSGSGSRMSDALVIEYIDSLREDLKELLGCEADFVEPSIKGGIKALERKLRSLKGLLSFSAKRCNGHDKLNQLFTHVQAMVDSAAYLAYSCLLNEMDEDMAHELALELSDLVRKIDPVKPEVREIYVGVMKASKSSESDQSNTYEADESVVDFVDSLLENISELLYRDHIMTVKDQIEILHEELRCLEYLLKDAETFTNRGNSKYLLAHAEVMAIDAGSVIYSLFVGEVNQEIAKKMGLALSNLLDKFKVGEVLVRKQYINVQKAQISNFPKIDELGALDLLLRNLNELVNDRVDSITLLKGRIQIVQKDLEFLGSFLNTIAKQHNKHEKLEDLWRRIIHVVYEVEYVIDLAVIKDGPFYGHRLWLSDLIEEIKHIKTEISEIKLNMYGLQEHDVTKISSSHELSQTNGPIIDGEVIGLKDEEEKVVEHLVWGSMQLQIVSIVGMAGLGKTFLTQKVYNSPIIKDHFYVRAWCSVSQVYERKELLIILLSQVKKPTEEQLSTITDEDIAEELYKCLKGQKYLIILDDIWDIGAWHALRRSFPNDNIGSRIVFTSRFSKLALQAKPDSKLHQPRPFFDSESWELLQKKIFQTNSCPLELHEVGQQIAKCCNGLPLAVVVVAGLLARTVKEQDQWREVADSLSSYIISDPQRQCMDILDLSYKSLPDHLKSCFLYLGAFPEDKEILVTKLTWLWIAEGFIRENQPNLEYIAEGYLMNLIDRSLVMVSKERSAGGVKTCLVHDLVRDFCLVKAKEENFFKLIQGRGDSVTSSTSSKSNFNASYPTRYEQRRVFVHYRQGENILSNSFGPCVRSLLLFAPRGLGAPNEVSSIVHRFKLLRVLDLMCINILDYNFPQGIKSMAQLRFLAVYGDFRSLPPSITNLWKLETLIVRADITGISLYTILNMTKLRHLHTAPFWFLPVTSFDDFSQLDSLQTFSTPLLSSGDDMEIMRRFPNLRKLSCIFRESWDSSRNCYRLPVLDFLNKLESLNVSYSGDMRHPCEFILPSNIKKLTMSWFRLPWEQISIVGKLPNLQVLKLLSEAFEGREWNIRDGEFPKLKFLKLRFVTIRKWTASGDYFPPLERLILDTCIGLEEIPSCLEEIPTLKLIQVYRCSNSLETSIKRIQEEQRDMGNEELKIDIRLYE